VVFQQERTAALRTMAILELSAAYLQIAVEEIVEVVGAVEVVPR
jgi:hypothetical protein